MSEYPTYYIATDGAFRDNCAAWGFVIQAEGMRDTQGNGFTVNEAVVAYKNVGAEIYGVLAALKQLPDNATVEIIYDFDGLSKWVMGEWQAKNPLSAYYVKQIQAHTGTITFHKPMSSSDNHLHHRAHKLANTALLQLTDVEAVFEGII